MDDSQSLIESVQKNDYVRLEFLLHPSRSMFLSQADIGKALKLGADEGHAKCVQVLLDKGAPVDAQNGEGLTPLISAASKGHNVILTLLLKAGASPDKATFRLKATALHWAATHGHLETVKLLVRRGASLSVQTVSGRTPLMLAARADHRDIVECLVEAGSDINVLDNENATVIHLVAEEGCVRCARILLPLCDDIDARMRNGDTPLIRAVKRGQTETVKLLTRWRCDHGSGGDGLSAIHWAAERGHADCVEVLLETGSSPNATTKAQYQTGPFIFTAGVAPLMLAAKNGHEMALGRLLKAGAVVDAVDKEGRTALLYAIKHNHPRCLLALIAAGADPDGVPFSEEGRESQQVGSLYGQYGQDTSEEDEEETESSDGSEDDGDDENSDEVDEERNYDRNQLLDLGDDDETGNSEEPSEEENENNTPQKVNKTRGISPLFLAIKENQKDCLKILLRSGCNLDVLAEADDGQYVGPFEYALVAGFIPTAKMLLACGLTRNNVNRMLLTMAFELLLEDESDGASGATGLRGGATGAEKGVELVDWFIDHLRVAPPLMSLCRKTIRDSLGRRVTGAIPELHLPKRLEDFVSLKELDDY